MIYFFYSIQCIFFPTKESKFINHVNRSEDIMQVGMDISHPSNTIDLNKYLNYIETGKSFDTLFILINYIRIYDSS